MNELLRIFVISHHSRVDGTVLLYSWVHVLPFSRTKTCGKRLLCVEKVVKCLDAELFLPLSLLLLLLLLLEELLLLLAQLSTAAALTTRPVLLVLLVFFLGRFVRGSSCLDWLLPVHGLEGLCTFPVPVMG